MGKEYLNSNGTLLHDPEFRVSLTADGTATATRAAAIAELTALALSCNFGYGEGATVIDCAHACKYVLSAGGWKYAGKICGGGEVTLEDVIETENITDATITMGDIEEMLEEINTAERHVMFDVSTLGASMYLCTIFLDSDTQFYRIFDLVTGFEKTGFYKDTDLFVTHLRSIPTGDNHYTVKWDKVNAACTRLNAAAGITTTTTNFGHFGSVNANYDNPFDSIYPWSGRKLCNININTYYALEEGDDLTDCVTYWEGEAGFSYEDASGVWVYTPPFYGRSFETGNYRYFDVTDKFTAGNVAYPAMITGRWHGCQKTLTIGGASKTCFLPIGNGMPGKRYALSTMHTEAKNYNGTLVDIYKLDASILLMVVEFATLNSQSACGNGVSSLYREDAGDLIQEATTGTVVKILKASYSNIIAGAIFDIGTSKGGNQVGSYRIVSVAVDADDSTLYDVTLDREATVTTANFWSIHGKCNTLDSDIGSKSGYIGSNGQSIAYYRGEELWANLYQYILGAYKQAATGKIFICSKSATDNYDAIDVNAHIDTGLTLPQGADDAAYSGYINTLGMCDGLSIPPFCTAGGGTSSNPVGDYCYTPAKSAGATVLLLGGNANNGANAGAFYERWYYSASNSNWYSSARPALKTP